MHKYLTYLQGFNHLPICLGKLAWNPPFNAFSFSSHSHSAQYHSPLFLQRTHTSFNISVIMIGNLLLLILLPIPAWVLYSLYCLASNYNQARKMGLSIVILPIDSGNPLWMSVDTHFIRWFKYSPFGKGRFTRFNWRGWEIQDRYRAHQELGDAFVFVTPGKNWLQLCNAEALADVFQRRDDFVRPIEMLGKLALS